MAKRENDYKAFPITNVVEPIWKTPALITINIDDDMMIERASKMTNVYCDMGFWEDLKILAEYLGIKKRNNKYLTAHNSAIK